MRTGRWMLVVLAPLALLGAGQAGSEDSRQGEPTLSWPQPATQEPVALDQLATLAWQQHPELAAALARVERARGQWIQAGLYLNPMVAARWDKIGDQDGRAGNPGALFSQEIITANKLRLAQLAAANGVSAADWQAVTRWFDVLTRLRMAYFETLTAQRAVEATEDVVRIAQDGLDAAERLERAGVGTRPDVIRARVERDQLRAQLAVARQRLDAAWRLLAAAVGRIDGPRVPLRRRLEDAPPRFDWEPTLHAVLERSSEVHEARALVWQADQALLRARAEVVPNVTVQVTPYYSYPDRSTEVYLQAGAFLPLFNRNQGNIYSAEADVGQTRANVRLVAVRLAERLAAAYQRYRGALELAEAYRNDILPSAQEALRLVRRGYERGDPKYDYTAVLQAQRILTQAELAYVQALGDLWRAVSEVAGLLQLDTLDPPPP